jgi:hypothetical protein
VILLVGGTGELGRRIAFYVVNDRCPDHLLAFSDNGARDIYAFPVEDGIATDNVVWLDHETGEQAPSERAGS